YLMAKDLILAVIGDIGCDGATYQAMEFDGDGVYALNIEERMTLCNMVIEAGGKNGVIAPDQVTLDYVNARNAWGKPYTVVSSDEEAKFVFEKLYDVTKLEPVIAKPHSPDNRAFVGDIKGTKLDRAYIGSCTGGKMTDFRAAATVLTGKTVRIDTFVVPATSEIAQGLKTETLNGQTLEEVFRSAGAKIGQPSCAACLGGPSDTFGRLNEPLSCISTTNRNFPGRMGHKEARVYLASPLTVAASAVTGVITDPRDYLGCNTPPPCWSQRCDGASGGPGAAETITAGPGGTAVAFTHAWAGRSSTGNAAGSADTPAILSRATCSAPARLAIPSAASVRPSRRSDSAL